MATILAYLKAITNSIYFKTAFLKSTQWESDTEDLFLQF